MKQHSFRLQLVSMVVVLALSAPSLSGQQDWLELVSAIADRDLAKVTRLVPAVIGLNARHPRDGTTPLILAAVAGDRDIAEYLLNKGADVNAKDRQGLTALMYASLKGAPMVMALLIAKGADVTLQDSKGRTAHIFATAILEGMRKENPRTTETRAANRGLDDLMLLQMEKAFTECIAALEALQKRNRRLIAVTTGKLIESWYGTIAAPLVTGAGFLAIDESLRTYEDLIEWGARELGASLSPRPNAISKTFPKNPEQLLLAAEKLKDNWDKQVRAALGNNDPLLTHYVIGLLMGNTVGPFEVAWAEDGKGPVSGVALGKVGTTIETMRKLLSDRSVRVPKALDLEAEALQNRLLGQPKGNPKWFEVERGLERWFQKLLEYLSTQR